jgi:magnesium chelatase subunit I
VRSAVANVFDGYSQGADIRPVVEWFDMGGSLQVDDSSPAADLIERAGMVQGLPDLARVAGVAPDAPAPLVAAAIDFVLEGLFAMKKISRTEEWTYQAAASPRPRLRAVADEAIATTSLGRKKRYYN